jgi:hypothetical protein
MTARQSECEERFLAYIACRINVEIWQLQQEPQTATPCLIRILKLAHNARDLLASDDQEPPPNTASTARPWAAVGGRPKALSLLGVPATELPLVAENHRDGEGSPLTKHAIFKDVVIGVILALAFGAIGGGGVGAIVWLFVNDMTIKGFSVFVGGGAAALLVISFRAIVYDVVMQRDRVPGNGVRAPWQIVVSGRSVSGSGGQFERRAGVRSSPKR